MSHYVFITGLTPNRFYYYQKIWSIFKNSQIWRHSAASTFISQVIWYLTDAGIKTHVFVISSYCDNWISLTHKTINTLWTDNNTISAGIKHFTYFFKWIFINSLPLWAGFQDTSPHSDQMSKFKIRRVIQYRDWCGYGVLPLNISPSPQWSPVVTSVINVHAMWGQVTGHCDQAIVLGNYKRIYSSPALMDYNSYKNWKYIEWCGPRVEEVRSVKVK